MKPDLVFFFRGHFGNVNCVKTKQAQFSGNLEAKGQSRINQCKIINFRYKCTYLSQIVYMTCGLLR